MILMVEMLPGSLHGYWYIISGVAMKPIIYYCEILSYMNTEIFCDRSDEHLTVVGDWGTGL